MAQQRGLAIDARRAAPRAVAKRSRARLGGPRELAPVPAESASISASAPEPEGTKQGGTRFAMEADNSETTASQRKEPTMDRTNQWHPTWYKDEHATKWDRVKEAVRRDWQQTKHDLHMGGHELNQQAKDTMKQASGSEAIPSINDANPPKVIGDLSGEWERVEQPLEYGFAARNQFGAAHKTWDDDLERDLRTEWESPKNTAGAAQRWDDVRPIVRHGYDYKS